MNPPPRRATLLAAALVPLVLLAPLSPFSGIASPCAAQTPPAAPAAPDTSHPNVWDVSIDLSASGAHGNEQYLLLTSGFNVRRLQTTRYALQLDGQVRYGTHGGQTIARLYRGSLHYDITPDALWSPFVFVTGERDLFRKLELRAQAGAGAKYTVLRSPTGTASVSLAVLYSHEDVSGPAPTTRNARFSWRVKGDQTLASGVKLSNVTFYQPYWDRPGDYLISSVTSATSRITDHIALTVSYDFERNSVPPEGVLPDDQLLNAGLKLTF
jgi:hypothetical protein